MCRNSRLPASAIGTLSPATRTFYTVLYDAENRWIAESQSIATA